MDQAMFCNNRATWIRFLKGLAAISFWLAMGCGGATRGEIDETYGRLEQALEDPCDVDGDGHQSLACGGDDCDDGSALISPGSTELCDGLDNDCDRIIDEECVDSIVPDPCTKISCRWP